MARTGFFLSTSLLLVLSLSIASATDYVNPQTQLPTKPNQDAPVNIPKPNPVQLNKPKDYTDHIPKPKPKLDLDKPEGYGVVPKQVLGIPKLLDTEKLLPTCIEGLVLCKQGQKFTPIKGAKTRITCYGADENNYETVTQSILSPATNDKGYFLITLPTSKHDRNLIKLTECKAYLQDSPLETCKVPTDIDNGMTGALLDTYRILKDKKVKLYRVKPFIFEPEPQPNNGY